MNQNLPQQESNQSQTLPPTTSVTPPSQVENIVSSDFENVENDLTIPQGVSTGSQEAVNALNGARLIDTIIQILLRIIASFFFGWLLGYQNVKVFGLVIEAIKTGSIDRLQLIFSALVSVTLFETYKIAEIMVKWLFKDINYS